MAHTSTWSRLAVHGVSLLLTGALCHCGGTSPTHLDEDLASAADGPVTSRDAASGGGDGATRGGDGGAVVCTSGSTAPGRAGPTMNPGLACINCHSMNNGPKFEIAGTVYPTVHEPDHCVGAVGATVEITDANNRVITLTTNSSGNFYYKSVLPLPPLAYPYQATVSYQGRSRSMGVHQSSGDCNGCHTVDGTNGAPGRIFLP